jgi:hypothetical protein
MKEELNWSKVMKRLRCNDPSVIRLDEIVIKDYDSGKLCEKQHKWPELLEIMCESYKCKDEG